MAGPAAAQLYIGATIGQAEFKEGCLGTGECDDKDGAWKILGGYQGNLNGPGADEDTTDLTYGIGVRWDFTKRLGVRGEWQRYEGLGGGNLIETDVDVLSIGLIFSFE